MPDAKPTQIRKLPVMLPAPEQVRDAQSVVEQYALGNVSALALVYVDAHGQVGLVVDPGPDVLRLLGALGVAKGDVEAELVRALNA